MVAFFHENIEAMFVLALNVDTKISGYHIKAMNFAVGDGVLVCMVLRNSGKITGMMKTILQGG